MIPRTISENHQCQAQEHVGKGIEHTVDVAETTCFTLLRMMKSTGPVDGDIAFAPVQAGCPLHTTTSTDAAEVKKSIEDWTIIADVVFSLLFGEVVHIVRCDLLEEVDVLIRVELGHFMAGSWFCALGKHSQWTIAYVVSTITSSKRARKRRDQIQKGCCSLELT